MYNDQDGHFTQQGWLTELLTVIDPSLQIYDMDKSEALPEDAQDQLGSVVGGQMNLKAQTIDGSQISNVVWTIGGNPILDYQLSSPNPSPQPLTNLAVNPIAYYWVQGSNSNTVSVTATITKNGTQKQHTISGYYFVATPSPYETDAALTSVQVGQYISNDPFPQLSFGTQMNLPSSAGILYTSDMMIPGGDAGYVAITQLIQSSTTVVPDPKASGTPPPVASTGGQWWDDGCSLLTLSPNGSVDQNIYFFNQAFFQTIDAPAQPLSPNALSYTINDSFRGYYMFKMAPGQSDPNNDYPKTIWVSLGRLDWSYTGTATKTNGTWSLTSYKNPLSYIAATSPSELPTWSSTLYSQGSNCPSVP